MTDIEIEIDGDKRLRFLPPHKSLPNVNLLDHCAYAEGAASFRRLSQL